MPAVNEAAANKVGADHLRRAAYLYVRQSTLRQVVENTTSTDRQYGLRRRAVALGWAPERVVVIDSDLGQSGASAADREGFQRLVADVGMGKAGIVIGLEVSRLARNNADWQRLLEICALTETLILDEDGLYDPCGLNDRLLLGLKGQMSEAELHLLRARLRGGILARARRGELALPLPVGLVYDPAGKVVLDPDAQVQGAIGHLFMTFARTGSARATVTAFAKEDLTFPRRLHRGPHRGELAWGRLEHSQVLNVLHNPRYAGAFCYGRNRYRRGVDGAVHSQLLPRDQWTALIPGAHPGYLSFEDWERNQALLAANAKAHGAQRRASPPREGPALLQGMVVCGRCGRRMTVRYHTRRGIQLPEYLCQADAVQTGARLCQFVPGGGVDQAVGQLLVATVTPLALTVALAVADELDARAGEADTLRRAAVERARQHAELARRRYLAVDPHNRLVADTLEADWNDALRQLAAAQEDYQRQRDTLPARLDDNQRATIMALASDFPALWSDPATPQRERKRMARLLIEDVTLVRDDTIAVHTRFRGGKLHSLTLPVPLRPWETRRTPAAAVARIDQLLDAHTERDVARILNDEGLATGDSRPFDPIAVARVRRAYGLTSRYQRLRAAGMLTAVELAAQLGVSARTVREWLNASLLAGEPCNDKHEYLYHPPGPNPPVKLQGRKLSDRAATTRS